MGISPSGATIFTSQLYDISDKEIGARSGIVDPRFWEECDSCMPDRVFTIADDLKALNVELNIPAFRSGGDHLTKAEENHICIHVECAIQRIKTFYQKRNSTCFPWFNKSVMDSN